MNFLPAEKAGTVFAAILIAAPVCGLRPVLAFLLRASKVPKPTKVTFLPFATVFCTVSIVALKTSAAAFCETFDFFATSFTNSSLLIRNSSCITRIIILIFQVLAIVLTKIYRNFPIKIMVLGLI